MERVIEKMGQSERFQVLSLFTTVHGIGPNTARSLYDRGLRSFRDLEAYYEVDTGFTPAESSESEDMNIRIALGLRDDLIRTCGPPARTWTKTLVLTLAQYTARRS
jgi:DNA polymerase mu